MVKKICEKEKAIIEDIRKFPEANKALERSAQSPNTVRAYARGIKEFADFLHKTPTEIVAEYRQDIEANQYKGFEKWEEIFADFDAHLQKSHEGQGVIPYHAGALALINNNVPRSLRLQAKVPDVYSKQIVPVSKEDLKVVYGNFANTLQKALIAFLNDSGMSAADVVRLKVGILEDFDKGGQWIHLRVTREKEHVDYETFIGPNAVNDLRIYIERRRQIGEVVTADSPLFASLNKNHAPYNEVNISRTFINLSERAKRTISSHRIRKFFETYMAIGVRHPIVLKYWMGHKIKGRGRDIESRYVIMPTPEQLKLYQDAYPNIDLTGGTLEDRVKMIEELQKQIPPELKAQMDKYNIQLRQKGRKRKTSPDGRQCEDGEHCGDFREIEEGELLEHLKARWRIVHNLQNGKVIVER